MRASGVVGRRYVPLWLSVEQGTGGVDVDHLLVNEGPVALLGVLLGGIPEEAAADCLLHAHRGLPTGNHVQLVPDEDKFTMTTDVRKERLIRPEALAHYAHIQAQYSQGFIKLL